MEFKKVAPKTGEGGKSPKESGTEGGWDIGKAGSMGRGEEGTSSITTSSGVKKSAKFVVSSEVGGAGAGRGERGGEKVGEAKGLGSCKGEGGVSSSGMGGKNVDPKTCDGGKSLKFIDSHCCVAACDGKIPLGCSWGWGEAGKASQSDISSKEPSKGYGKIPSKLLASEGCASAVWGIPKTASISDSGISSRSSKKLPSSCKISGISLRKSEKLGGWSEVGFGEIGGAGGRGVGGVGELSSA